MSPAAHDGLHLESVAVAAGAVAAAIAVDAASPWFAGHFPHEPVLPAIAHLALAERLHRAAGGGGAVTAIDALRLLAPVLPGDRLEATLGPPDPGGRRAFAVARAGGGARVSRGTLGWAGPPAGPRPDDDPAAAAAEPALGAPPALPHAGPSLLLAAAATLAPGEAAGRGRVPAGHAAIVAGRAAAFTAIELAAQLTTALAAGPARPLPAGAPRGYLVRLRAVRLAVPSFPVSTPLLARVVLEARNGPLATFRFDVRARAGGRIVDGALATYSLGP